MDTSVNAVGKRIRETRRERGYTREQLAEYADISADFLGAVETGRKSMSAQILARLARALDVTADFLLFGTCDFKENSRINMMLAALSEDKRRQVEKMITLFVDTFRIYDKERQDNDKA